LILSISSTTAFFVLCPSGLLKGFFLADFSSTSFPFFAGTSSLSSSSSSSSTTTGAFFDFFAGTGVGSSSSTSSSSSTTGAGFPFLVGAAPFVLLTGLNSARTFSVSSVNSSAGVSSLIAALIPLTSCSEVPFGLISGSQPKTSFNSITAFYNSFCDALIILKIRN
jgi:hypothetical protein